MLPLWRRGTEYDGVKNTVKSLLIFIGDVICYYASFLAMVFFYTNGKAFSVHYEKHFFPFLILMPLWFALFFSFNLYRSNYTHHAKFLVSTLEAFLTALLLSFIFFYFLPSFGITPKNNLLIFSGSFLSLFILWRRGGLLFLLGKKFPQKVFIFAEAKDRAELEKELQKRKFSLLDEKKVREKAQRGDLLVVHQEALHNRDFFNQLHEFTMKRDVNMRNYSRFYEDVLGKIPIQSLESSWVLDHCGIHTSPGRNLIYRLFDLIVALSVSLLVLPLYLLVLAITLVLQGKPLFFTQERVGYLGKPFVIFKLRTMVNNAEKNGAQWAQPQDARVTPWGKFLRKTRLDEVPQLINIIRGEMSFVGPRPERPEFIGELAESIPFYNQRHLVRPGLTGWAQVNYPYGFSVEDALKKLQFDMYYIKNRSIALNLLTIFKTISTVIRGIGH